MTTARTVPLRYLARIDPGKSEVAHLPDSLEVDFIPMEAVGHGGVLHPQGTRKLGEVRNGYTYIASGDVSFAKISPSFQNRKGGRAAELTNGLAFGTTELTVLRPGQHADGRYLQYVVESEPFIQRGTATMHGVAGQQRVDIHQLASTLVHAPPVDVQRRVADMLDVETARIDTLIKKNERVINLVSLRVESAIEQAIYGEPDVDWMPLQVLSDPNRPIRYGIVLPGPDVDDGVPLIKGGDVHGHSLVHGTRSRVASDVEGRHRQSRVKAGDIVYAIRGSFGDVEVVPESLNGANITQDVARISPLGVNAGWLFYALRAPGTRAQAKRVSRGSTISGVNIESLRAFRIPVPKAGRQAMTAEALASMETGHDHLARLVHRQQELLRLRRQALISAAVTGQIEV